MNRLYPYLLEAKVVPAIWGGSALVGKYGKTGDAAAHLGESWECWGENKVRNGDLAGQTLDELYAHAGPALLGLCKSPDPAHFPILTKLIDAREALSVQVHPDDAKAKQLEDQPNGKTECWTILEAAPDAEIVLGFSRDVTEAEVRKHIAAGTLGEVLRRLPVKSGETYFLPAGTVHAIGAGIVLFEAQQRSELTYRLYDWNRKDASGKGRELHIDKSAKALRYKAEVAKAVRTLSYRMDGMDRTARVADERFGVEEFHLANNGRFYTESVATILSTKEHEVRLRTVDAVVDIAPWSTVVIPAGLPRVDLEAADETSVFSVTCAGADARLRARLDLIAFDQAQSESFIAQFSQPGVAA